MSPKTLQKTTITDVAPSIEDKNNMMIVHKTLFIDEDDNKINSLSGDEKLMSHKELEHLLDDNKRPSFSSNFSLDSKVSTNTNLIGIKIKIQKKSKKLTKYVQCMKRYLKRQIKSSFDCCIVGIIVAVNTKAQKPLQSASHKT
eukprot:11911898-Ditylum_brightwellii.AAC.1